VRSIRTTSSSAAIGSGTNTPEEPAANPITISTNIAYTVHFYAASHSLSSFRGNITTALNKPLALFVTEYGGCQSSGSGNLNTAETQTWWNFLDANGIGCTAWAVETNSETSSVFVGNASANGPWTNGDLTNWGSLVFPYIASQYAATVAP